MLVLFVQYNGKVWDGEESAKFTGGDVRFGRHPLVQLRVSSREFLSERSTQRGHATWTLLHVKNEEKRTWNAPV